MGHLIIAGIFCLRDDCVEVKIENELISPQACKLGIKSGARICLINAPVRWQLIDPPTDISIIKGRGSTDILISFFTEADKLPIRLLGLVKRIYPAGALCAELLAAFGTGFERRLSTSALLPLLPKGTIFRTYVRISPNSANP